MLYVYNSVLTLKTLQPIFLISRVVPAYYCLVLVLTAGHNTVTGYQTPIPIFHPYAVEVRERVIKDFLGFWVNFVHKQT